MLAAINKCKSIGLVILIVVLGAVLGFSKIAQADYSSTDLQSIVGETPFYYGEYGDCSSQGTGDVTLTGGDNEQEAYNFFIQKGLTPLQASAVVGNLMDESGMDPTEIQSGGNSNDPSAAGSAGWGIAQWTPGSKVILIAQSLNITSPIDQLGTQLTIVWDEMTGTSPTGVSDMATGLEQITGTSSSALAQAVTYFDTNFEGGITGQRLQDAQDVFNQYGSSNSNSGSTNDTSVTPSCNAVAINCSTSSSGSTGGGTTQASSANEQIRQNIVCIAEQQLALWSSQPGYNTTNFPYAANGYLTYSQGTYEEWCAAFTSWVYNQAGDPLQPDPDWDLAGVDEVVSVAEQSGTGFTWHPAGSGYIPQPGDLAVHYIPSVSSATPEQIASDYNHINVFISSSGGVSTYIGGDQGNGPYGAPSPTTVPPNPPSESVVSTQTMNGYWGNSSDVILGYVSPN